ncbi:MAG TPA: RNA polymerase factor sigma-54 [Gammaproteobacteria bacterium]|nr:RNA polymerase factor sigma-54 [Gammaproteobacteria bacterium]
MKPGLQLKLSTQLTMTPQLQQAIRLLQLSTLELQQEITHALEANPLLEVAEESGLNSLNTLPEHPSIFNLVNPGKNKADAWDYFEQIAHNRAAEETLREHLLWQMRFSTLSQAEQIIATTMIDALNDAGYLPLTLVEIQEILTAQARVALEDIEYVLRHIQHFDPPGIAARNLQECLVLQIKRRTLPLDQSQLAIDIINHDLPLLANHAYAELKRTYHLTDALLLEIIKLIKSLNPKPGLIFSSEQTEYIIPDLLVYKHKNNWQVMLNPDNTPKIRINTHYTDLIKQSQTATDHAFLKEHLQDARWLIKSLENRFDTLLKVGQAIIERQQGFLEFGEESMHPLVLTDIAMEVEMHESTISRITTQKYIHTPRGVFELKYFFSSHVHMQHGGECSSTAIRALIKKLIAAEDPAQPLSDSKLASILQAQGINIARRTVAKYREALLIASSNERKRQHWPLEGR